MTSQSEVELVLDRYLADGVEQVPDRVIDAALRDIEYTHQRRALRVPWRFDEMPVFKLALAGAAVLAVLVVGGLFLNRGPGPMVGAPPAATATAPPPDAPTASPAPSSRAAGVPDTTDWVTFKSERYGYEIGHPPNWKAQPASRDWSMEVDRVDWLTPAADVIKIADEDAYTIRVTAFAVEVPSDMAHDDWIAAYYAPGGAPTTEPGCEIANVRTVFVDGDRGQLIVSSCSDAQAFVFDEGRVHVFSVWRPHAVAFLEAFLSTVRFDPPGSS